MAAPRVPLLAPVDDRRRLGGQGTWFAAWVVITGIGLFLLKADPDGHGTHRQLGMPPCPSVLMFSRPCPGCGLTTSWTSLLHGDLAASFQAHPFGPFLYAVFTATALLGAYGLWRGLRVAYESPLINRALWAFTVVFVAFGVWRFMTRPYPRDWSDLAGVVREYGREPAGVPEEDAATEKP